MICSKHGPRAFQELCKVSTKFRGDRQAWQQCRRLGSQTSRPVNALKQNPRVSHTGAVLAVGLSALCLYESQHIGFREAYAEAPPTSLEVKPEQPKKRNGLTKEDNRDLISSQHLQVKKSWENPGVYAWGSNSEKVAAPDSDESYIKSPRRIPYFDGVLLRDIKLERNFGAAVTENGDLLQWGISYSKDNPQPSVTLRGKDLVSVGISQDRVLGLSKSGKVYSLPVSQADQTSGPKPQETSWIPFWSSRSPISYRIIQPKNLGWGEKVSSISSGLEHVLLLTSSGRVFSAAASSEAFPSRGQLGVPGLTWTTRPEGPYDMCHEIITLRGFDICKVAAGEFHSLALDKEGRVFAFGDNSVGQLGFDYSAESPIIDAPSLLPAQKLYKGTNLLPKVTNIAAGGVNSFFAIDATRVAGSNETTSASHGLGRVTADTWSCGQGTWGGLGNGRWTHVQGTPIKIKALSGLFEWDEKADKAVPIRLAHLSVGSTHAAAVMNNVTHVGASETSSESDTNWGADVLWWGGNEYYQLGTGKRSNLSNPTYIAPMDVLADKDRGRKEAHRFQITPRHKVKVNGRTVSMEQRIECGRYVTAVYSGV